MTVARPGELRSALGIGAGDLVAVVGGGGKTTLMYRVVAELRRAGLRAAAGTTTKILPPSPGDGGRLLLGEDPGSLAEGIGEWDWEAGGFPVLGRALIHPGKVDGIPPGWAHGLLGPGRLDCLVLEADGAGRRPVKAPEDWEPVVPEAATVFVAVAGMSCLGRPVREAGFRPERLREVTGLGPDDPIGHEALVRLFSRPRGAAKGCPRGARAVAVLNQADDTRSWVRARAIAGAVLRGGSRFDRVVVCRLAGPEPEWEVWQGEEPL